MKMDYVFVIMKEDIIQLNIIMFLLAQNVITMKQNQKNFI